MMKRLFYALSFLTVLQLLACEDDKITTTKPSAPRLDYYVESFDYPGLGFKPQLKVTYEYFETGELSRYTVLSYNSDSGSLSELRYFVFSYLNNRVDKIKGYQADDDIPYIEYSYSYLPDGRVSGIQENNYSTGINSQAGFSYDTSGSIVNVSYTFSNGGSFQYEFQYSGANVLQDKTTRGSQVCSDGKYTYDQHLNPFRNLGYVDYTLNNLSVNNKLTEDINFLGCAFPTLIPVSYAYEYNESGYPTVVTTSYKSGSSITKSKKNLFYK